MHFIKPLSTTISMAVCLSTLIISSSLANGLILGVIVRFKKLRTFPNILLANAALVDLLNALINMPTYLLYCVLEVGWLKGKTMAILSVYLSRLLISLHLVSTLSLLVNAFLGIAFDFRYFTWKSKEKGICVVVLEWLMSLVVLSLFSIPLFDIDLQDAHLYIYRQHIYSEYKTFHAATMTLFIACAIAFGALSVYSIRRRKLQRKSLQLSPIHAEARLQQDIKASKTVVITVVALLVCFIQPVWFALWNRHNPHSTGNWITFLVNFSLFLSSGINPFIYFFRARRFRLALKQLLKDPCGRSSFQETSKRAEQKTPPNIADQATTGNEVHKNKVGEAAKRENAEEANGQRNNIRRLSFRKLESERQVVKKAWAEKDEKFQRGESSAQLEERHVASDEHANQGVTNPKHRKVEGQTAVG